MIVPNSHQPHAGNAQVRLNERKIVKTISLKKVSAVAVASLGFGLLSVVPANAALATTVAVVTNTSGTVYGSVGTASGRQQRESQKVQLLQCLQQPQRLELE